MALLRRMQVMLQGRGEPKGVSEQQPKNQLNPEPPFPRFWKEPHSSVLDRYLVDQGETGQPPCYPMESPTIEELEENLRKLKVQVDSLASSLSVHGDEEDPLDLEVSGDSDPFSSRWQEALLGSYVESTTGGSPKARSEWFSKPRHLLRSLGDDSALTHLGIPTRALPSGARVAGLLGTRTAAWNSVPRVDLTFPLKLGAPHVIGVRSLLPPKTPVRSRSPERSPLSFDRGRSRSLSRSESSLRPFFSPTAKRSRRLRPRSQSPRPVWRPSSAKANACAQPPPQLGKPRGSMKKNGPSRRSRPWIYRPGTLASRADPPSRATKRGAPNYTWSPYSLPSSAISSPTAQELNERFLQTLAGGALGGALVEMSPYEKQLARLRLERLRLEEAWLLELKRQQELERTRGPKPKWYELRNSQFHYEARKNNELLRNGQDLQAVCKYRQELATASREFQPGSAYMEAH